MNARERLLHSYYRLTPTSDEAIAGRARMAALVDDVITEARAPLEAQNEQLGALVRTMEANATEEAAAAQRQLSTLREAHEEMRKALATAWTHGYEAGLSNEVDDWNRPHEENVQAGLDYAARALLRPSEPERIER